MAFTISNEEGYKLVNNEKDHIEIDKTKETRTKEISKMIGEGGLGADNYYNIKKESAHKKEGNDKD